MMLTRARARLGWSQAEAGRQTGIARRMLGMMEAGERVPSVALAEELISGYMLGGFEAELLRAVALPNVGRDSPYRDRGDARPLARRVSLITVAAEPGEEPVAVAPVASSARDADPRPTARPAVRVVRPGSPGLGGARAPQPSPFA